MEAGDGSMIGRIRQWFTPPPETRGYVDQLLSTQLAAAQGAGSVRDSGVYRACLNLISDAAATAELTGEHSEVLQPRLGAIARQMVDVGQSAFELVIGRGGGLELLPVEIVNISGGAAEDTWFYTLARSGPMSTMTTVREQAGVLNFRSRVDNRTPWRGQPAIQSGNSTAKLLNKMEIQLTSEAAMKPARIVVAGIVKEQRKDVTDALTQGGIVTLSSTRGYAEAKGLNTGEMGGSYSAAGVELHGQLVGLIASALGVPVDLVVAGGSDNAGKESLRRFAFSTITALLQNVIREWERKVGPLQFNLDALRAADEVSRARAVGSRANAVSRLVASGMDLPQALEVVGID